MIIKISNSTLRILSFQINGGKSQMKKAEISLGQQCKENKQNLQGVTILCMMKQQSLLMRLWKLWNQGTISCKKTFNKLLEYSFLLMLLVYLAILQNLSDNMDLIVQFWQDQEILEKIQLKMERRYITFTGKVIR